MLVRATGGAADILSGLEGPAAAGTRLPAGVQLIAFEIEVGSHHLFFEFLDFLSRLEINLRRGNVLRWAVRAWFLFISHCGQLPVAGTFGGLPFVMRAVCGWSHPMVKNALRRAMHSPGTEGLVLGGGPGHLEHSDRG